MSYKINGEDIVKYSYIYDANGNISKIKENGKVVAYYIYDSLNQLRSVNDGNQKLYSIYSYDNSGNITSKKEQSLHPQYDYPIGEVQTTTYTYGDSEWKDKLTKFNDDDITYDAIGNPLSYRDGMSMTWQNGRELAKIEKPNDTDIDTYSFKYNLNGLRTEKNIGDTKIYYYYDRKKKTSDRH